MPVPWASILPAITGTVGSLLGSAVDRQTARENIDRQAMYNRQLAEYSFGKNLEMWNLQNQYNSPVSQMQRLTEAGLNPNLVYGSGVVANNASAPPRYEQQATDVSLPAAMNFPQMLSMYNDTVVKAAQVDNIKANTLATVAQALGKGMSNELLAESLPFKQDLAYYDKEQKMAKAFLTDRQQHLTLLKLGDLRRTMNERGLQGYYGAEVRNAITRMGQSNALLGARVRGQEIANKWAEIGASNPLNLGVNLLMRMLPVKLNQRTRR